MTTIIDNLLQGSVYRKYVKLVSGIMITLIIINPVIGLIFGENTYDISVDRYINKLDIDECGRELRLYTDNEEMPLYYKDILKQSLVQYLETEGYEMVECEWNIVNDVNDEMYGSILGLKTVVKSGKGHTIDEVYVDENGQIELYNRELELKIAEYYSLSPDMVEVVLE